MESMIMEKLGELKSKVVGSISYDSELVKRELAGGSLITGNTHEEAEQLINGLEKLVSQAEKQR